MRTSRFTEERIVGILQEHAAGAKTGELVRRHGIPPRDVLQVVCDNGPEFRRIPLKAASRCEAGRA